MKKLFYITFLALLLTSALNAQQVITYNFNDGTWGTPITERPESGTYTSSSANEVKFNSAVLYQKEGKGTIRVILDKSSTKSNLEFPEFNGNKKDVVIEASAGTDGKTLSLEQKTGNKWVAVSEPVVLTKQKASYSFTLSDGAKQIRILNPTTSALYIYKVIIK